MASDGNSSSSTSSEIWDNASILFTNGTHILSGVSLKKRKNKDGILEPKLIMSGIGGRRDVTDKTSKHTAIREFMEEIFGFDSDFAGIRNVSSIKQFRTFNINDVNEDVDELIRVLTDDLLIKKIVAAWTNKDGSKHASIVYAYGFESLLKLLAVCREKEVKSRMYDEIPITLDDLLFKRKTSERTELMSLTLLPAIMFKTPEKSIYPEIASEFGSDLKKLFSSSLPDPRLVTYEGRTYFQESDKLTNLNSITENNLGAEDPLPSKKTNNLELRKRTRKNLYKRKY